MYWKTLLEPAQLDTKTVQMILAQYCCQFTEKML